MTGLLWFSLGLITLVAGSELLVRQGTKLAVLAGVPPIIVGLTVVAVGTSAPELAVGIEAALLGKGSLAVGNIAGTNAFNILFILGLSAFISPLQLHLRTLRYDMPVMILSAGVLFLMAKDGVLTRYDGALLVTAALLYTSGVVVTARREARRVKAEFAVEFTEKTRRVERSGIADLLSSFALLAISILVVVKGADWLVQGAADLARQMGVSDAFIGLTVVAIGTSAPEFVTTMISTMRNERDIAVGNLVGSSVYNIFAILGLTALFPDDGIRVEHDLIWVDIPVTGLAAVACIPVFLTGRRITRLEGASFMAAYIVYFVYLVIERG
ncbi:calcium/sodium antiporter [Rhizobium binxianense]